MDEWWYKKGNKESIVVQHTDAMAVYFNIHGDVVIRQESDPSEAEDKILFFDPRVARLIAQAILTLLEKPK